MKKYIGAFLVCLAGICWGLIGIFTRKLAQSGLDSVQITMIRNFISAVELFFVVLVINRKAVFFKLRDIWIFLGTGIVSIALFNICYFYTLEHATMNVASVLLYTAPVMVMLLSAVFFHEKIYTQKIFALIFAFVGCVFTTGIVSQIFLKESMMISSFTILTGLLSGLFYALYSIFGKVALKKYSVFTVTLYTFLFAFVSLFFISKPATAFNIVFLEKSNILNAIFLSTFSTVVPFICYTFGLKYLDAGHASVMAFIEPMVATICGIVIFDEMITIENIIGIILIFISVLLLNIKFSKNKAAKE